MAKASSKEPLSFRLATPQDTSRIIVLINTAFRSEKTGQTWLQDDQDRRVDIVNMELVEDLIAGSSADTIMLAGTLDNTIVTTCFLRRPNTVIPNPDKMEHITPGAAWLGFLAVDPAIHSKGYGKAMLREAERVVLGEWQVTRLEFDFVSTRTELMQWYYRQGYAKTGKTRPFIYGEEGRQILVDGLEMIVLGKNLTARDLEA